MAYGGCEVMRRENKIQKVRVETRLTYAEAVRVSRDQNNVTNEQGTRGSQELQQSTDDRVYVDKRALVTLIAGMINSMSKK